MERDPYGHVDNNPVDHEVKKLASKLGVDLEMVMGMGPDGVVTEKDVRETSAGPAIKARIKLSQVRRDMNSRML
jgi:pyruvate/2-oxoglutarate dehydrogenase complex dihydrolipoamide acyltransferase (E2) component